MLRKWLCQADVTLRLHPVDPVLIKSGYATVDGADMAPVRTYRDGKTVCYFPGTSLKGVLRGQCERIARTLRPGSVCLPYYDPRSSCVVPVLDEQPAYGCGYRRRTEERDPAPVAYSDSCAACRLFGSLKFTGRFGIGDAYPLPGQEPKIDQRNGVGIDRFTGGTVPGLLFDLEVLVGGTFETQIRLVNFELWQLAAVNLLLADLQDEMISLGSGRSRSLGRVRGEVTAYRLSYLRSASTVQGLGQLATDDERQAYGLHDWNPEAPLPLPPPQVRGLRHEYSLQAEWSSLLQPLAPSFEQFLIWHGGPRGEPSREKEPAGKRSQAL